MHKDKIRKIEDGESKCSDEKSENQYSFTKINFNNYQDKKSEVEKKSETDKKSEAEILIDNDDANQKTNQLTIKNNRNEDKKDEEDVLENSEDLILEEPKYEGEKVDGLKEGEGI